MTTADGFTLSSTAQPARRERTASPVLFATLLAIAGAIVVAVLVLGPSVSAAVSVPCALIALALVTIGWIVAGPRL